ncbi:AraC family transcriptional regulator [Pseudomonas corrugata]|uniref:helix-turn-helix domain-containing protein n=1 Tax=Pseudomonas corrugata TaxID=47879 RepID=UPI00222E1748|nr:AraC family transcriptional regulator [Pseudomonas corrugata]UZD97747.1 AraC family transcriptional regulator [Pseudomonas corrugata]
MNTPVTVNFASTNRAPLDQRCELWESYSSEQLIGLRCSSFSDEGFSALGKNVHVNDFGITHIQANEHVIERDTQIVKAKPKESVFFSLILSNNTFFYQGKECFTPNENDLVIYRTDKPYLFGFSSDMQKLIFDMPADKYRLLFGDTKKLDKPTTIKGGDKKNLLLIRTLQHLSMQYLQDPRTTKANSIQDEIVDLLRHISLEKEGDFSGSTLSLSYLISAKRYLLENLHNPNLNCEEIAIACGISSRHLARIFAKENTTVTQYLLCKRLERAAQLLISRKIKCFNIAEIAYQCGFTNQAHFSRAFKAITGVTPKNYKESEMGQNPRSSLGTFGDPML